MSDAKIDTPPPVRLERMVRRVVMPRWKMLDVVWLKHYWNPRSLIVGIRRSKDDPNDIRYECLNEGGIPNGHRAEECLDESEWREDMQRYLGDEYSPREWRWRMERVEKFREPACWEEFRQRYRDTGDPFLPWVIDGKLCRPTWQVDETYPPNTPAQRPAENAGGNHE